MQPQRDFRTTPAPVARLRRAEAASMEKIEPAAPARVRVYRSLALRPDEYLSIVAAGRRR